VKHVISSANPLFFISTFLTSPVSGLVDVIVIGVMRVFRCILFNSGSMASTNSAHDSASPCLTDCSILNFTVVFECYLKAYPEQD